jgi:CYTH domain-containing protein
LPTENERKFVINKKCESLVKQLCIESYEISQGYLVSTKGVTLRLRKTSPYNSCKETYYFTLKSTVNNRVIELEHEIDKRDFHDLWQNSINKLEKTRYKIKNKKLVWELDFFYDYKGELYFALAECELPEGVEKPETIPDIIKNNLIFEVPLDDNRFANKHLGDPRYCLDLMNDLTKEKNLVKHI